MKRINNKIEKNQTLFWALNFLKNLYNKKNQIHEKKQSQFQFLNQGLLLKHYNETSQTISAA